MEENKLEKMNYIKTFEQFINESVNVDLKVGDKFKVIKDLKPGHLLGFTNKHANMINRVLPAGDVWEISGKGSSGNKPGFEIKVVDTKNPGIYISQEFVYDEKIFKKLISDKIIEQI